MRVVCTGASRSFFWVHCSQCTVPPSCLHSFSLARSAQGTSARISLLCVVCVREEALRVGVLPRTLCEYSAFISGSVLAWTPSNVHLVWSSLSPSDTCHSPCVVSKAPWAGARLVGGNRSWLLAFAALLLLPISWVLCVKLHFCFSFSPQGFTRFTSLSTARYSGW